MVNHLNFYETIKEARMRLQDTIVVYDGEPCYVYYIADDRPDGVFRMYLCPFNHPHGLLHRQIALPSHYDYAHEEDEDGYQSSTSSAYTKALDDYVAQYPDRFLRKKMNSPKFNKFRPFPLGMVNYDGGAYYVTRTPTRHTQQGLTESGVTSQYISLKVSQFKSGPRSSSPRVHIYSSGFRDCIVGEYPSYTDSIANLLDPEVLNESVAFSREFAAALGPCGLVFIWYKQDCVGYVKANSPHEALFLDNKFSYVKEAAEELGVFASVVVL